MTRRRPPRFVRFHYHDGQGTITEPTARLAARNGTTPQGAVDLINEWLQAGDLKARPDGGYDVIHYRPPRRTP